MVVRNSFLKNISLTVKTVFLLLILCVLLTGCASNISRDWDCPAEEGYKCIPIRYADRVAVRALKTKCLKTIGD